LARGLDRVGVSYRAATADFDNGDLDLIVNNADAPLSIYRNNSGGRSIRVELRGRKSNHFGVGATVTIEAGGRRQAQYVTLARGWLSALEPVAHFGLGETRRTRLTVGGRAGLSSDSRRCGRAIYDHQPAETAPSARPSLCSARRVHAAHRTEEEPFGDFAEQPLPYGVRLGRPSPGPTSTATATGLPPGARALTRPFW
jgi:hypothetical protein